MAKSRFRPNVKVRIASPNHYSPRGTAPSLIVLHSTESHNRPGTGDLEAIGHLFASRSFEASSHVSTDADGNSGRWVDDSAAAWTQAAYNRMSLSIEQIGFASQGKWAEAELKETARWIARWSHRHGIPIRKAWTASGRVIRSGVTTHAKLGAAGGSHTDPGSGYPLGHVLDLARRYKKELRAAT